MKKLFCLSLLLLSFTVVQAQANLFPNFIRRIIFQKDSSRKPSFLAIPVISSTPETGIEAGLSGVYSFYSDTVNRNTRVSNVFGYGTLTTKGQSRVSVSTSYWVPQNTYHYSAYLGYINFPANFYGIGSATHSSDAELIGETRLKFNFAGEKLIAKNVYVGFLAGAYNYTFTGNSTPGIFENDPNIQYRNGGASLFVGPSFSFDTRNTNTYTTKGMELVSSLSFIQGIGIDGNYTGGIFQIEYTLYFPLSKRLMLGFDLYDNSLLGGQSPFFLMPELGSDELMRGYYNGRYRDRNYSAGQTELRYRLTDRFAIVGFTGMGTVYHDTFYFNQLKPNYGGGLRYFFDVEKGLTVRMDYGIGEQRPGESRQSGFYIGLGEAF